MFDFHIFSSFIHIGQAEDHQSQRTERSWQDVWTYDGLQGKFNLFTLRHNSFHY